tara:strand:- start:806 stop:1006 length:201 start_codon:yes stop_codon:yes gene_type:complete
MTIENKISKIADWISNESQDRYEEIEWLLYFVYQPKKSGLTRDIDDDYESVLNYKKDLFLEELQGE